MADGVHVRVGSGRYVFAVAQVREVEDRPPVTLVPGAPSAVLGVCNLRGAILPLVELAPLLGQEAEQGAFILVAEAGGLTAGLTVDEILGVEPVPEPLEPGEGPVAGSAMVDGELLGVVDAAVILRELADAAGG